MTRGFEGYASIAREQRCLLYTSDAAGVVDVVAETVVDAAPAAAVVDVAPAAAAAAPAAAAPEGEEGLSKSAAKKKARAQKKSRRSKKSRK